MLSGWCWILLIIGLLITLIVFEYLDHDCLPHKQCYHRIQSPNQETPTNDVFYSLHEMLRSNLDFVIWRQALVAAIGASILIIIFLYGRFPTPFELFFVGLLIFLGVYFSLSWMRAHFHAPNTLQIERGLFVLEDKIKRGDV